jgi:hypothetical protein
METAMMIAADNFDALLKSYFNQFWTKYYLARQFVSKRRRKDGREES